MGHYTFLFFTKICGLMSKEKTYYVVLFITKDQYC